MGVLLQAFYFLPGRASGVPSPLGGDNRIPFWWDHLATQAGDLRRAGFSAIWLPPPLKGSVGGFSNGYDVFDDYDLGDKDQKGTVATRFGTRELLERCVAVMRANGLDIYVDMVENHRDGDDGNFNFQYVDAYGRPNKGRFPKGKFDFHPNVPPDPGVFDDVFSFGRDLAPINGAGGYVFRNLIAAGDWLTRALDIQGYRLDAVKGISTLFLLPFLNSDAMRGKFAVGEFFDGNIGYLQSWMNAMQHRCGLLDFPLFFMLRNLCNDPIGFDMASLDRAGLIGADPLGSVTFCENCDTDLHMPIVRNKAMAYAFIMTAEGYPCVFYKDYSTDPNCFGMKPVIDNLMWIHEQLAEGPTLQRWKDFGVFAFERLAGAHLLVGMNKDEQSPRTITVDTGFGPNTQLHDFTGHGWDVWTDWAGRATITIPRNTNGLGYVCYSRPRGDAPFVPNQISVTQDYEGASDLDLKPADNTETVTVCRVYAERGKPVTGALFFDAKRWTDQTHIRLDLLAPDGTQLASRDFQKDTPQGTQISAAPQQTGYHTWKIRSFSTPNENEKPSYRLRVSYTAPQDI